MRFVDLTGREFGQLRVLRQLPLRATNGSVVWLCACSCGREASVPYSSLRSGQVSCGCRRGFARDPEAELKRKLRLRVATRRRLRRERREMAALAALTAAPRCRVCHLLEPHDCVFGSVPLRQPVDIL